ncbi:MAG: PorT family protein [Cytophagaceae bacterium]|jgi:hypothetical protein|nr:PorT family protein [Cytophagaceae bacterium]
MRIVVFSFFYLVLVGIGNAQVNKRSGKSPYVKSNDPFTKSQFYIGIRAGIGGTSVRVKESYQAIQSIQGTAPFPEKNYHSFSSLGGSAGLDFTFAYLGFQVSFQPAYRRYRYFYDYTTSWTDTSGATLTLAYDQQVRLDYLELPLFLKYEFLKNNLRPFIQAGISYGILNTATHQLTISGTDNAFGSNRDFEQLATTVGANDLYISSYLSWGLGAGASYQVGNVRVIADITYRLGSHVITNRANRFDKNPLVGSGDVSDDVLLNSLQLSVGCLFPLKYLASKQFKAVN